MRYVFELKCPRCGKQEQIVCAGKDQEVPHLNCGDCLWEDTEIIEFTVVRCTVIPDGGAVKCLSALFAVIVLAWAVTGTAEAQTTQHTFRDSSGRTMGRSVTDSQGRTNYYDSMGRTTGRSATDSRGNTTVYDNMGRQTGTIQGSNRK